MKFIVEVRGEKGWEIVSEDIRDLSDALATFARHLNDGNETRLTCEHASETAARAD